MHTASPSCRGGTPGPFPKCARTPAAEEPSLALNSMSLSTLATERGSRGQCAGLARLRPWATPALGHPYTHQSIKGEELCEVCFHVFCQAQLQAQSLPHTVLAFHIRVTDPSAPPSLVPGVLIVSLGLVLLSSAKLFCAGLPFRAEVPSLPVSSSVRSNVSQCPHLSLL